MKKLLVFICAITFILGLSGVAMAIPITTGVPTDFDATGVQGFSQSGIGQFNRVEIILGMGVSDIFAYPSMSNLSGLDLIYTDNFYALAEGNLVDTFTFDLNFDPDPSDNWYQFAVLTWENNNLLEAYDVVWHKNPSDYNIRDDSVGWVINWSYENWFDPAIGPGFESDGYWRPEGSPYGAALPSDPVPEPSTILLFGTGLFGLVGARRKLKRN